MCAGIPMGNGEYRPVFDCVVLAVEKNDQSSIIFWTETLKDSRDNGDRRLFQEFSEGYQYADFETQCLLTDVEEVLHVIFRI